MTAKKTAKKTTTKKKATKKTAAKKKTTAQKPADPTPEATPETETENVPAVSEEPMTPVQLANAPPQFQKFEIAKRIAHTLANSNLVPEAFQRRPNDCFVAINMGAEIGLEPFQAIQSIAVIDGRPCLWGDGLIGVVRTSPLCEWIEETVDEKGESATCTTKRKGDRNPISATYTLEDAQLAGLLSKYNWKKHPRRMLQMRARSYCLRDAYPDLLRGLSVAEEMLDHEDTPPPITDYKLPERDRDETKARMSQPPVSEQIEPAPEYEGEVIHDEDRYATLGRVERAIIDAKDMTQLLKAGDMAKELTDKHDIQTARLMYSKKRDKLLEADNAG